MLELNDTIVNNNTYFSYTIPPFPRDTSGFDDDNFNEDYDEYLNEEEIEYNPNTYNAVLLEALTPKQKKLLKIGAAVAGATALGYGAYKYNQNRKAAEEARKAAEEEAKQGAAEEEEQEWEEIFQLSKQRAAEAKQKEAEAKHGAAEEKPKQVPRGSAFIRQLIQRTNEEAAKRKAAEEALEAESKEYRESEEFKKLKEAYDDLKREYDNVLEEKNKTYRTTKYMTFQEREELLRPFDERLKDISQKVKNIKSQCKYPDLLRRSR